MTACEAVEGAAEVIDVESLAEAYEVLLSQYVTRRHRWLHGGLQGQVSRKGGVRRHYIYILRRLKIP